MKRRAQTGEDELMRPGGPAGTEQLPSSPGLATDQAAIPVWREGRGTRNLSAAFNPRANAVGFLRLLAAGLVLIAHTLELGGFGKDPLGVLTGRQEGLGSLAVAVFFVLSGFLIARSFIAAPSIRSFLRRRAIRILPGYWTCVVVTAFAFGGVLWWHEHGSLNGLLAAPNGPFSYIERNWLIIQRQRELAGLLRQNLWGSAINGSLWTLIHEVRCYLIFAALGRLGLIRCRSARVLLLLAAVTWAGSLVSVPINLGPLNVLLPLHNPNFARLAFAFTLGALAWVYGDRIPMHRRGAAIASFVLVALVLTRTYSVFGMAPLAYVVLYVASVLPVRRLNTTTDISYGVYIYAFPVQQSLVAFGVHESGLLPYFVLVTAITVALAWLSWKLVEKPMMRLR